MHRALGTTTLALALGLSGACAERRWDIEERRALGPVGAIEMEAHPSGELLVTLELGALPPPDGGYVVWLRPMGMHILKAGHLSYDPGSRRGTLRMITPYESFELLVTAERSPASTRRPGGRVVARRVVQRE